MRIVLLMKFLLATVPPFFVSVPTTQNGKAKDYLPLVEESAWRYQFFDGVQFRDSITTDNFLFKGRRYFEHIRRHEDGSAEVSFYRQGVNGDIIHLDTDSWLETVEIPHQIRPNYSWKSADGHWEYKIAGVGQTFKTPIRNYKDCLVVKAKNLVPDSDDYGISYENFYAKGIGYVGGRIDGELDSYLLDCRINLQRS